MVLLALAIAGCGGNSNVQVSSGGPPSTGASVHVQSTTFGALLAIGLLLGLSLESDWVPEMDPARRVHEQDCSKPIEDWSANLRCR